MSYRDALLRNTHRLLKLSPYAQQLEPAHAAALVLAYEQEFGPVSVPVPCSSSCSWLAAADHARLRGADMTACA